jgi:ubiquinol-cytochrome c reductase iron-sulfur subunit
MRTPHEAAALGARSQQPPYAKNWHRSINPQYAALIGVCTYCKCVVQFPGDDPTPPIPNAYGGYICPCCASHHDSTGRAYRGITQHNLAVSPYDIDDTKLVIGKNPVGVTFAIESIERI